MVCRLYPSVLGPARLLNLLWHSQRTPVCEDQQGGASSSTLTNTHNVYHWHISILHVLAFIS